MINTGFKLPKKCLRKRKDCNPLSQIVSEHCISFFCVGKNDGSMSKVKQDKHAFCFKGEHDDNISLYDKRDLIHNAAVLSMAIAIEELETK